MSAHFNLGLLLVEHDSAMRDESSRTEFWHAAQEAASEIKKLERDLIGARFAARMHLETVQAQSLVIAGMQPVAPVVQAAPLAERDFEYAKSTVPGIKAVLYTDDINGKQVMCDDLWLATTEQLNLLAKIGEDAPQAVAAPDREAALDEALKIISAYQVSIGNSAAGELACEWTMDAIKEIHEKVSALKQAPQPITGPAIDASRILTHHNICVVGRTADGSDINLPICGDGAKGGKYMVLVALQDRDARIKMLEEALQFYANGDHFHMHDADAWDTVSGEPMNFYEDESNTATVEDGTIAKMVLAGTPIPDGEDEAPQPIAAPACFMCHGTGKHAMVSAIDPGQGEQPTAMVECQQCKPIAAPACTRSHPHEDMSAKCIAKTDSARVNNATAAASQQPVTALSSDSLELTNLMNVWWNTIGSREILDAKNRIIEHINAHAAQLVAAETQRCSEIAQASERIFADQLEAMQAAWDAEAELCMKYKAMAMESAQLVQQRATLSVRQIETIRTARNIVAVTGHRTVAAELIAILMEAGKK